MAMTRRSFLRLTALAGGGLSIGISLAGCGPSPMPPAPGGALQPNAWLQLLPDDTIIFLMHKAEMGQGVYTGLTTVVAEELDVSPERLRVEFAPVHPDFRDPLFHLMVTGGSNSVSANFETLREAAATMRALLVQAAAQRWGVAVADCNTEDGIVHSRKAGKQARYGELVTDALTQKLSGPAPLKSPSNFKYMGRFDRRLDARDKVTGKAQFGLDVMPEALKAVVVRCPQLGGTLGSWDGSLAKSAAGVVYVFPIHSGIAVVAQGYWQARKAADMLKISWQPGPLEGWDSARIGAELRRLADTAEGTVVREDELKPAGTPARVIEGEYSLPYLAHATMEPMNAVVSITEKECLVWAGTQSPDVVQDLVSRIINKPREFVTVRNTFLGGGFGRRVIPDYIAEAAAIAAQLMKPVQLIWSREDDLRHDRYRPAFLGRIKAELSADGRVQRWHHRLVGPSVNAQAMPVFGNALFPQWVPHAVPKAMGDAMADSDRSSVEGAKEIPYAFDNIRVENVAWDPGVPLGYWRSVGHSHTAFVVESFLDEVAHALGQDPVDFRVAHLPADSKYLPVLKLAAEKAGWGLPLPGRSRGVAVHESFGSVVAHVVEVSVLEGQIRVHRVVCAVDCGMAINPDIVRGQMESGVVFGLTAALKSQITLTNGAVDQSNFHDYPMLRMDECPEIEVHILPSTQPPTGVGEPGTPPVAPAVANAVFAATGQRLRSLPLRLS